jgi:hypothetical protein
MGELLGTGKLYEKSYGLPPVAGGGVEVPQRPGFSIEALSLVAIKPGQAKCTKSLSLTGSRFPLISGFYYYSFYVN